jgi:hypothetical protein
VILYFSCFLNEFLKRGCFDSFIDLIEANQIEEGFKKEIDFYEIG